MTRPTRDQAIRQQRRDAATRAGRGQWPIATDRPVDRARTLALAAVRELEKVDPDAARRLVERAHGWGETWLGGGGAVTAQGEWLTRAQVAALARVEPDTVSQWTTRKKLTRHPQGYAEREVMDFLGSQRTGTRGPAQPQEDER